MQIKFEWEEIWSSLDNKEFSMENRFSLTYRAQVIGGWLIRHETLIEDESTINLDKWNNIHNTMTFIADPDHKWRMIYEDDTV